MEDTIVAEQDGIRQGVHNLGDEWREIEAQSRRSRRLATEVGGAVTFGPPQQMVIPDARVRLIRNRSVQVGVPVMTIGLALSPILVLLPYQLVPYGDPLGFGIALFAGMLGLCTIGAGGMALLSRAAVRTGYLGLPDMRAARGALMFCWLLGVLSAVMAFGTLKLVVSTPPQEHRATVRFDGMDWLYVLLLVTAAALCGFAFFAIRRVLWRPRDGWAPPPPLR